MSQVEEGTKGAQARQTVRSVVFFFILRSIYRIQKCLVWMSTPHFHTPITSTRHFYTRATPFKLPKSVTSTRHFTTNPSLRHVTTTKNSSKASSKVFLSHREHAVWNSRKFDKKIKIYIIVEVICVEVTCRSSWLWRVEKEWTLCEREVSKWWVWWVKGRLPVWI